MSGEMSESRLPPLAIVLGVAGLLPFFAAALNAAKADIGSTQSSALPLITYGAVVLSFLGGVHWGFVLEGPPAAGQRSRLGLGVLPGLIGWAAALLGLWRQPFFALALLIAAFVLTAIVEGRAQRLEMVPSGYMVLRWILTIVVVAVLTTVLVLRMVGGRVLF
jgi:hypothetical protein